MAATKPTGQKETLDQLWYAVIGTNGDGLVGRMAKLEKTCTVRSNGRKKRSKEVVLTLVAVLTAANFLGLIEPIGHAFRSWVVGG